MLYFFYNKVFHRARFNTIGCANHLLSVQSIDCKKLQVVFLEGPHNIAVSTDSKGRLLLHNVTNYLSLAAKLAGRLSKSVQPMLLTDGRQLGPICQLANLQTSKLGQALRAEPGAQQEETYHALEGLLLVCSARGASVGQSLP